MSGKQKRAGKRADKQNGKRAESRFHFVQFPVDVALAFAGAAAKKKTQENDNVQTSEKQRTCKGA